MTKNECRNKIKYYLRGHKYKIIEDSTITKCKSLVYELEGGLVLKITTDKYEIEASKKLKGLYSRHLANVKSVKDFGDFHIIIVEKLEPLSDKLKKSHKKFRREIFFFMLFYNIVRIISFGLVKPDVKKLHWMFTKESLSWLLQGNTISRQAKQMRVEYPSDYLNVNNLGIKMGTIAAFDLRNAKNDYFFEKIW